MGKLTKIVMDLFPILQPEWIFCRVKDVPADVLAGFYEEEMYLSRISNKKVDIIIGDYRYILTSKRETFMIRRKISLL